MRTGLSLLLIAAACARAKSNPAPQVGSGDPAATSFAPALGVSLAEATKLPSGLYLKDLAVGTGAVVTEGQQVAVHYVGWLPDGNRFDGNENGAPFTFKLGAHQVIPGWEQGIAGMHVGGKRQLVIPGALGYGTAGNGPIPPNAVLVFTVEVVSAAP